MYEPKESLNELAELAHRYYQSLLERGIPLELAVRMTGDWHATALQAAHLMTAAQLTRVTARTAQGRRS